MKKNTDVKREENFVLINPNNSNFIGKRFTEAEEQYLKINKIKCTLFYIKLYNWNILLYSINFISYFIYILSLESCGYSSTNMCTDIKGMKWYYKVVTLSIVTGIIQSIFISLILFKNKGYKHLLYDIPIYIYFFYVYNGTTVEEHGLYNFMIFLIAFILSTFILTYLLYFIYFIFKRSKISLLFIIFVLSLSVVGYRFKPYDNCENWKKSINNTLDNDSKDYPCKIKIPKKCVLDKLGNIVDMPRYLKTECHLNGVRKNERKIFLDSIKSSQLLKMKLQNLQNLVIQLQQHLITSKNG